MRLRPGATLRGPDEGRHGPGGHRHRQERDREFGLTVFQLRTIVLLSILFELVETDGTGSGSEEEKKESVDSLEALFK